MVKQANKAAGVFAAVAAITGWLSIVLQLYLIINNRTVSTTETIIRFFSYFTIQTNILVAICFTAASRNGFVRSGSFFSKSAVLTAAAVYITLTGLVYNTILRFLWQPEGLQFVVDEALHTIQPLLFVIFWALFIPKQELKWKSIFSWLLYPVIYVVYLLILGALTGFYPYPFADVNQLGYSKTLLNAVAMIIVVLLVSFLFVAMAKAAIRRRQFTD